MSNLVCPNCGGSRFTHWHAAPSEIELDTSSVSDSACEVVTEIICKSCSYFVQPTADSDLWDAVQGVFEVAKP